MKPLRCLLFSSNGESISPIWPVLAELGIEGDYCQSAVDAVEKVTTQIFEIVVTDWEDQPEATFLLKTARDLKAAHRPLTLAIVSDDAKRPEALRAGANSILLKPIRPEQVRDTLSTACELIRSKLQGTSAARTNEPPGGAAFAAAASAGAVAAPVLKSPEEIQQTEPEINAPEAPPAQKLEAATELPLNSATSESAPTMQLKEPETLTGWAMLQARLTQSAPPAARTAPAKQERNELLAYEHPTHGTRSVGTEEDQPLTKKDSRPETDPEAALFDYIAGKPAQRPAATAKFASNGGRVYLVAGLAIACGTLAALPKTRQIFQTLYQNSARSANRVLNPPPAPLPPAVVTHDSFGQSGDEYSLPTPANIPDATTDPSQIRVLPVIDPTAKPQKTPDANTAAAQTPSVQNPSADQEHGAPAQDSQEPAQESETKPLIPGSIENMRSNLAEPVPASVATQTPAAPNAPVVQMAAAQPPVRPSNSVRPHVVTAAASTGIPSSLKSQIASSTPQSSGSKPIEAAMASIEPVNLPEPAAREQLAQPVDPAYPAVAKGQRGTVMLQVLIGRDGAVQDAKFLQGSFVFARAAIDAVKQWRFKPYLMNGRAVSVQSVITLSFKPPA